MTEAKRVKASEAAEAAEEKEKIEVVEEKKEEKVEEKKTTGPRYFIKNNSELHIVEKKPGVGEYTIPAHGQLEVFDVEDTMETPIKTKVTYVRYTAKQIAEAIVQDFGRAGILEIVVDDPEAKKAKEKEEKEAKEKAEKEEKEAAKEAKKEEK